MVGTRQRTGPVWRLLRDLALLMLALLLLGPVAAVLLMVESEPRISAGGPPDAAAAAEARALAEGVHHLIASGEHDRWTLSEREIDATIISARRVLPALRGDATVAAGSAALDLALGPPTVPAGLWLNARVTIAPSSDGVRVTSARIGRLPLPPALVLPVLRLAGDRLLGDDLVSLALDTVSSVAIAPPEVTVHFSSDPAARTVLFARIREAARGAIGADENEPVYVHLWYLARADLPRKDSVLPYLRFVVAKAGELTDQGNAASEQIRGALLALALHCGDGGLGPAVGVGARDETRNSCDGTTLGGRDDLKRHFTVSAGIEAARSGQAALGVGELKELLDSNEGGSGFSFDDMAANLAGVRFARLLLSAPRGDWPAILARIDTEADILPPLGDLPTGLSEAEFRTRYGDVDSPQYAAMIAEIERRIDALPIYRAVRSN